MTDPKTAWLEEITLLRTRERGGDRSLATDTALRTAITAVRRLGATWQEIGDAAGTTRQYVNKRFGP